MGVSVRIPCQSNYDLRYLGVNISCASVPFCSLLSYRVLNFLEIIPNAADPKHGRCLTVSRVFLAVRARSRIFIEEVWDGSAWTTPPDDRRTEVHPLSGPCCSWQLDRTQGCR